MTTARLSLKTCLLKAEVNETLVCGRVTWTLNATRYDELRKPLGESLVSIVVRTTSTFRTPKPAQEVEM